MRDSLRGTHRAVFSVRDSSCFCQGRWVDLGSVVQVSWGGVGRRCFWHSWRWWIYPFVMSFRRRVYGVVATIYIPVVECGCLFAFMFPAWVWICRDTLNTFPCILFRRIT